METEVCFHLWCYSQCCLQDEGRGREKEEKGGGGERIGVERGSKRERKGERGGGEGGEGKRRGKRKIAI